MLEKIKIYTRSILRPLIYFFYYLPNKKSIELGLKNGITAVISMRDEAFSIEACLESLVPFVDQIVCIDNGSKDNSLQIANAVKKKYSSKLDIEVLKMPDSLLGDCRNEGIKRAKFKWHLRWDADMIARFEGDYDIRQLREFVLGIKYPCTVQLPRINLYGDLDHTSKNSSIQDQGEPFLVYLTKNILYKEYGRFDALKIPLYYKQIKKDKGYIFHLAGLKSIDNLLHRFHYFLWREYTNNHGAEGFSTNLEKFKSKRNMFLFETNNQLEIKYRYQLTKARTYKKLDHKVYGPKSKIIDKYCDSDRFKVHYKDGQPFIIIDKSDREVERYYSSKKEIKDWDIDTFFKKIETESFSNYL